MFLEKDIAMPPEILLVDDDRIFRTEFKDCFDEYNVIECSTGEEALSILKKPNEIELVILDVRMPGINGVETLKIIKNISPEVKVIVLTAYSSKELLVEILREHADDYIEKPIDINKTKEVIERLLKKKLSGYPGDSMDIKGKIERIKSFVQSNYSKKLCLEDVSSIVYLSPKYLSRVFKQHTGKGFSQYRLEIKIEKAKLLLLTTGYSIDQLADKLGYQNSESFIRQFKKHTSFTPAEYRKKNRLPTKNI
ncbi:MAG: response regulator [Candidatus Omnitrophota bacterium]